MLTQQCATLTLGHAAPHAELDAIVERIRTALELNRAVPTDGRGLSLRRTPNEQVVRITSATAGLSDPRKTSF
ncbi:hypothetical protein GCM10023217_08060 [Gordonia alkaliphila]|uniref:Uncharacterized protein n=1 Tax=Gordonia alkaliphila TaxID=1053547 RepID=A0ABP8YX39_9ACTN